MIFKTNAEREMTNVSVLVCSFSFSEAELP